MFPLTDKKHMQFIDSHCHLDIPTFAPIIESIVKDAQQVGVFRFILPGITASGWKQMFETCSPKKGLYGAPGLHPLYLNHHQSGDLNLLADLLSREKPVALGEIGLDYYEKTPDRTAQQFYFEEQLDLAKQMRLPLILHVRKAHDQVLATLRRKKFLEGGIVHAFSGSYQQAKQYHDLGFCIGVAGTITYSRALKIRKTVSEMPQEALVLETDSPDIPLFGKQGQPNLPKYLPQIAATLAELRNESIDFIAEYTTRNCEHTLRLDPHC